MYVRHGGHVAVRGHSAGASSLRLPWALGTELQLSGLAAGAFTH